MAAPGNLTMNLRQLHSITFTNELDHRFVASMIQHKSNRQTLSVYADVGGVTLGLFNVGPQTTKIIIIYYNKYIRTPMPHRFLLKLMNN